MKRVVVLASGGGTNLQALIDACAEGALDAQVVRVVVDRKAAYARKRAAEAGIGCDYLPVTRFADRREFDAALADLVAAAAPDLVVLAGFMRILSATFLDRFPGRVINLHPALPGEFPGAHAIEDAHAAAVAGRIGQTGAMIHYAIPEVDAGPVLCHATVDIDPTQGVDALRAALRPIEHRLIVEGARRALTQSTQPGGQEMTRRALLSVYDKTGLVDLARGLVERGFELVASGGTARKLREAELPVTEVGDMTGAPEVLDGRVKTLHPNVHAGILSRRTQQDNDELGARGIAPIDVVVCNLYPFEDTLANPESTHADLVEQIDIGGVTLLRAAAKNAEHVTIASSPSHYEAVLAMLDAPADKAALNRRLAAEAFQQTARYDLAISGWLTESTRVQVAQEKVTDLRYGENPHQSAALYRPVGHAPAFVQVGGEKALSYNNIVDMDAARACCAEFSEPAVVIVKHANPCGAATASTVNAAFEMALASDPVSAFGSIIAVNRPVEADFVTALGKLFVEVIVAPSITPGARAALARRKKNCRLIECAIEPNAEPVLKPTFAGMLVQDADVVAPEPDSWKVVTQRAPTEAEYAALDFNWRVTRHVKSNAIVFGVAGATVGVGAGQMNRLDAVGLAGRRAGEQSKGAVMASDAFFPFADGLEAAAEFGITAVIQPGGSIRDADVIAAADKLGIAMVFTGRRHFRH